MYVIITDSRKRDEILFMVDRSRQRASFWSNRVGDAMRYGSEMAAVRKAATLRFNNPRVIPLSVAEKISSQQSFEAMVTQASIDAELGWDMHAQ